MEIVSLLSWLAAVVTATYCMVAAGFIIGWARLRLPFAAKPGNTSVSVIIAARNEEANIAATIDAVLAQDYPTELMEVIVVNDHSEDSTADIVAAYTDPRVKLINFTDPERINSYKKTAITMAVNVATGRLIVTTDADCTMGRGWMSALVSFYEQSAYKMFSSPVVYHRGRNLFERLQSLEFLYLIGFGASMIGNGRATTCNGANLAYEREAFLAVDGYSGIDHVASGDDEMLLHKIAAAYSNSIGFLKSTDAIVYTEAKPTLSSFIQQRKRWASKSTSYTDKRITLIAFALWLFNVNIVVNFVAAVFIPQLLLVVGIQLLTKFLLELIFVFQLTSFIKQKSLRTLLPILTILHIFYIIYIGVAGKMGTYEWKGRTVN